MAHFDFTDCDPQARGPVNLRPSMVEACVFYSLIGSLGPNLHFNDGMRDVVRLVFAPHTIVNADPPGAGVELPEGQPQAGRRASWRRWRSSIRRARIANSGSSSALSHRLGAKAGPGQSTHAIRDHRARPMAAAWATTARPRPRPISATCTSRRSRFWNPNFPAASRASTSCRIPAAPANGAAGLSLAARIRTAGKRTVIRRFDKARFPPRGIRRRQGRSAPRASSCASAPRRNRRRRLGRFEMQAGERFLLQSAGGGGYGDPARRDRAALARDIAEGYVTAAAAKRDYGG